MDVSCRSTPEKLLPLGRVEDLTGVKRSTVYALMSAEKFPQPVKVGRASRWVLSEIERWVADRITERSAAV